MNKCGNYLNCKFNVSLDIISVQNIDKIKSTIVFKENYFQFKVTDKEKLSNKFSKKEFVKSLIFPIFIKDDDILINYGMIRNITCSELTIKFEVFHPIYPNPLIISLYDIYQSFLISSKKLNRDQVNDLFLFLKLKKLNVGKILIETLVLFFNSLKEGLEQDNLLAYMEDKIFKSFNDSKKYFEKTIIDLKKLDKMRYNLKKKIYDKTASSNNIGIKKSLSNPIKVNLGNLYNDCDLIDSIIPENIQTNYKLFESIFMDVKKKSLLYIENSVILLFRILGMENSNLDLKSIKQGTVSHQLINYKENYNTSSIDYGINNSVNFKVSNPFIDSKTNKQSNLNEDILSKSVGENKDLFECNGFGLISNQKISLNKSSNFSNKQIISNLKLNSLKEGKIEREKVDKFMLKDIKQNDNIVLVTLDENKENNFDALLRGQHHNPDLNILNKIDIETPKFNKNKNSAKSVNSRYSIKSNNSSTTTINLHMIAKNLEEMKKLHVFMPPNDYYNIIHNSIEISHRKFFEICFEEYFPNLFYLDKDKFDILKIECILAFFFYLKGIKNFLFTDENKLFYANLFFYED